MDDFNQLNLVIHGGKEAVAVALVKLRRAAFDYYQHPSIEQSERLRREIRDSMEVVEDRDGWLCE